MTEHEVRQARWERMATTALLVIQLVIFIFRMGEMSQQLDDVQQRVTRIENMIYTRR